MREIGGLVALSSPGNRREVGRIGLSKERLRRNTTDYVGQLTPLLERDDACHADKQTQFNRTMGLGDRSGPTVHHPSPLRRSALDQLQSIIVCLAAMDDHRKVRLISEFELPPESCPLRIARREVIVVVETDLADRNNTRMPGQFAEAVLCRSIVGARFMRMHADGGPDFTVPRSDLDSPCRAVEIVSDGDHAPDTRVHGTLDCGRGIFGEVRVVQMAMAVEHQIGRRGAYGAGARVMFAVTGWSRRVSVTVIAWVSKPAFSARTR